MAVREFKGSAVPTTITGSIASSGGGSVSIADATGWPTGAGGKFSVVIDEGTASEEKILVTSRAGSSLTFAVDGRGYDNTVAVAHAANATIRHCLTAADLTEANAHVNDSAVHLGTGTVTSTHLASGAVTAGKIGTGGVSAAAQLASDVVETAKIANGNVTTAKIADANVTTAKIADANVTGVKLADGSVATAKIVDANVTTAKIADANVTTAKIADANVTTAKIADSNVTTAKIADRNVTEAKRELMPTGRWSRSTNQAIGSNTEVAVQWTAESEDDLGLAAPTFSSLTLPATAGWYTVAVEIVLDTNPTSSGHVQLKVGGTRLYRHATIPASAARMCYSWTFYSSTSNAIEIDVYNPTGGSINITAADLFLTRLGAA